MHDLSPSLLGGLSSVVSSHSVPFAGPFPHSLALGMPMGFEWIVIALVALLIFGKRLPGMARGLGQGIVEFKRGLKGAEAEAESEYADRPRFDSQTGKPLDNA